MTAGPARVLGAHREGAQQSWSASTKERRTVAALVRGYSSLWGDNFAEIKPGIVPNQGCYAHLPEQTFENALFEGERLGQSFAFTVGKRTDLSNSGRLVKGAASQAERATQRCQGFFS